MAGDKVIVVADKKQWDDIHADAKKNNKTIVVDFTATWCGPCRMIGPYFDDLATRHPSLIFLKVDVDAAEDVAAVCGISAMPTFQVWHEGQKKDELVGASKEKLMAIVNAHTHDAKETTTNPATSAPKATGTAPPLTMPSGAAC